MEKLIQVIIKNQKKKLDDRRSHYTPEELLSAGLPDFLVRRMRVELTRRVDESVTMPESKWADMSSGSVRDAWDRFLESVHQGVRMPADQAESVLADSLKDLLDMMITPRAFLPDYIFGDETELKRETVKQRLQGVVVYEYFATAIPRFMEKKQREVLTKEQADRIIERLDERVTSKYNSLKWASLFDPWFELMGESIDSEYFSMFFRDKGKPGVARLFDAEKKGVNRDRLIEIISRPLLYDDDELDDVGADLLGPEDSAPAVSDDGSAVKESKVRSGDASARQSSLREDNPEEKKDKNTKSIRTEWSRLQSEMSRRQRDRDDSGRAGAASDAAPENEDAEEKPAKTSLSKVSDDISSGRSHSDSEAGPDEEENLVARFRKVNGGRDQDSTLNSRLNTGFGGSGEDDEPLYSKLKKTETSGSDQDDVPIWQQFTQVPYEFSSDEREDDVSAGEQEAQSDDDDSGMIPGNAGLEDIRSYVRDMEKQFINELFNGNKNAYLMALDEISQRKSWSQAGEFISREVFDRNMIDIYSDTAIHFTDRMQTYFSERT